MVKNKFKSSGTFLTRADRIRRRREFVIIAVIIVVVGLLTYAENRLIHFGSEIPVSNAILMFILININLLLVLLLIFLVFRNLVKLLYDRNRRVMGSRLRTRLTVAFIVLTLLPAGILFFFAAGFISSSIKFWFSVPVEQALETSLLVGREVYQRSEDQHRFLLEQIAYQVDTKKMLATGKQKELKRYVQVVQRSFNLHAVEVYAPTSKRLAESISDQIPPDVIRPVAAANLLKDITAQPVRSYSEAGPFGELFRTISSIPFGAASQEAKGFVVVCELIPADLAENMATITRGFGEYQQIKLLKQPIQSTYYITLSIVALLVVFCAIWYGFYLAKSISIPIQDLAEGTRRVAEGDLAFEIPQAGDDEIGSLVQSFNQMTSDLRVGREQLELSSKKLRLQNIEIEERRRYMEIVLNNVSAGVISLDAHGVIKTINKAAERMMNLEAGKIVNRPYRQLLKGQHRKLADEVMADLSQSRTYAVELPLRVTVQGNPRSFMLHITALSNDAGDPIGIVMVFDDLTELEKAQRMAAWREVARRIAHEVKNPLTPIALSAQRLKRRYSDKLKEPVFGECTQMIIDHVELIRNLVNEFSAFARFPTADPKPCNLPAIVEETVALYREGHPQVHFKIEADDDTPPISLDRQQIKQAFINLIDNAVAAMKSKGSVTISLSQDPILKLVRIEVADTGPGISDEDKTRLFEPNFSTKKSGMGLGLTIVSSIVMDHKGMVRVLDNQPQGAKFVIELPVA